MMVVIGVLLSLAFFGWLIWMAVKKRPVRAHMVMYTLSWLAGIFTLVYFLSMNIDSMVKILFSIILGAIFITLAASLQRRQIGKNNK